MIYDVIRYIHDMIECNAIKYHAVTVPKCADIC